MFLFCLLIGRLCWCETIRKQVDVFVHARSVAVWQTSRCVLYCALRQRIDKSIDFGLSAFYFYAECFAHNEMGVFLSLDRFMASKSVADKSSSNERDELKLYTRPAKFDVCFESTR